MKMLNSRTLAAALIAALLTLAAAENHAQEAGLNLNEMNDAMRLQVMDELTGNVQRLYESDWMTGAARDDAMRLQVMADLTGNVQRLYESDWMTGVAKDDAMRLQVMVELRSNVQWLYGNDWTRGAFRKSAVSRAVSAGLPPRAGAARLLSAPAQ